MSSHTFYKRKSMTDAEYMVEQINAKLSGVTIRNAIITEDKECFGFQVVRQSKGRGNYDVFTVWVDRDAEGNGSGWLNIDEAGQ